MSTTETVKPVAPYVGGKALLAKTTNSRIEMYLTSEKKQHVSIADLNERIELDKDEKILTEISCKFRFEELESLLTCANFTISKHYEPENKYFSLVLARF